MLTYFSVTNFKGFKECLSFDLSNTSNYEFNTRAIEHGTVKKAIVYGQNGCGKSNLGLAITDLVLHLTDKEKLFNDYPIYLNMNSDDNKASFEYHFVFGSNRIKYIYTKSDMQNLLSERLVINDETVLDYDFVNDNGKCTLEGTQSLKMSSPDGRLSKLKFIRNNAILTENQTNKAFVQMMEFVDKMLLFYCLMGRGYQGLTLGPDSLDNYIVKVGKLKAFENFLHKAGINEKLVSREVNGQFQIGFDYKKGMIPFSQVASTGTKSLELLYYWLLRIENASLVFIDEFDAFYHYELSEMVVRELIEMNPQIILTTHNTDLLSNDLLRPDCYFLMNQNTIKPLSCLTEKELRKAHNIQKMYKAGTFNE